MTISERIFKITSEKHISQSSFAKATGISGSTISDWKNKKTNPSADKIMVICEVLGITPEQLLTGKGIDEDYEDKMFEKEDYVITSADMRVLEGYHGLKEAQRRRLIKYMEALKQIEELEEM